MHLRRALLLFAIVLMLAALATSVTRPQRDRSDGDTTPPASAEGPSAAVPGSSEGHTDLRIPGPKDGRTARLEEGAAATLVVEVDGDGEVAIPGLGLTASATSLAPAHFELIGDLPGEYEINFTPAASSAESRKIGRLLVEEDETL